MGKKCHTLPCILKIFRIMFAHCHRNMCLYPQFSVWIPKALIKICFPRSHKPRKNIFVLGGNVFKESLCAGKQVAFVRDQPSWYCSPQRCFLPSSVVQPERVHCMLQQMYYSRFCCFYQACYKERL